MKILVLSPHRDDAAFSLSLALVSWLGGSHSVTLLNCFTRSLYAPYSDAEFAHPNDRLSYISAMRRREDELFVRQLPGATTKNFVMTDLNLKDAPLRLRCSEEELCSLAVNPDDPAIAKIQKALSRLTAAGEADAIVVPLGLGGNVDHRTVRHAALPLASTYPCAFYEDLPDAIQTGNASDMQELPARLTTQTPDALTPVFCRVSAGSALKRRLTLGYASQIDAATADSIADFCLQYVEGERLWANSAWLSVAESSGLSVL